MADLKELRELSGAPARTGHCSYAAGSNGDAQFIAYREALGGDASHSELIAKVLQNFGGATINALVLEELLDELRDLGFVSNARSLQNDSAVEKLKAKYRQVFHLLIAYQEKQKPKRIKPANGIQFTLEEVESHLRAAYDMASMSVRAMALETGHTTAAGGNVPAEIARKFSYGKFTFCKCCENFQKKLGLPQRHGQRGAKARNNMSLRRKTQLNGQSKSN